MIRKHVIIHGQNISYLHEGNGLPTLFFHTIGGSASEWTRITPHIRDHLEMYAIDLPGHGESYFLNEHEAISDTASIIVNVMDEIGIQKANLVGNSLSGTNAIETAILYPKRVDKVVLISGTGPWANQPGLPSRGNLKIDSSENKEIIWFRSQFLDPATAEEPGFFDWWVQSRSKSDDEMIRAWRRQPLLDRPLSDCKAPTLLLVGRHDPQHPEEWANAWVSLLSDGRTEVIENARHFLVLEKPFELAQCLKRFLA